MGRGQSFRKRGTPPGRGQPTSTVHGADPAPGPSVSKSLTLPTKFVNLRNSVTSFCAGQTRLYKNRWQEITSDRQILQCIEGVKIEFTALVDQLETPTPYTMGPEEIHKIQDQIEQMLAKGVIETTQPSAGQFVSNIFSRPKKDGSVRIILNLKKLNKQVQYHHFKMETLNHTIQLMTPGCFMASIDLKDAYYSIPVAQEHRKYLRFYWQGTLYQFTCLPNGLAEAPRKFTKVLRVPFTHLRSKGHESSAYIDDSALFAQSFDSCMENIHDTMELMDSLGFTIHPEKSVIKPTHILTYLGFILNSLDMTVTMTDDKKEKIKRICREVLRKCNVSIRLLAELIGTLVAADPGVDMGPVFYKRTEIFKNECLQQNKGNFDAKVSISTEAREDIVWWIDNIDTLNRQLSKQLPSVFITSDSSDFAWGGTRDGQSAGGPWSANEQTWHINVKELLAAFLTLKTFCDLEHNVHIRLSIDNTTSVVYINKQGGKKKCLNEVARHIWLWAKSRNVWLSAVHLPGSKNTEADKASRKDYALEGEWQLDPKVFKVINDQFGPFQIDLFATRINKQCPMYFAWKPDPDALAIDALSHEWDFNSMYAFPPSAS